MKTLAVIPALNESTTLNRVVEQACRFVDEVIVVDDGSTKPLAATLPVRPQVQVIRHEINLGKGAAMKTGTIAAQRRQAEIVVFLDADGQHNPEEIPSLLQPIIEGRADIAFGVRSFHQHMPFVAKLGNIALTQLLRWMFGIYLRDTQSGFRAFRVSVFPKIVWESPRYAVETEMIVNTGKHHLRWVEVPIQTIYLDKYRGTTVLDGIRIFINMIAWRLQ